MNRQLCTNELLNLTKLWNSIIPNISDCFQYTFLCVPSCFLLIFIGIYGIGKFLKKSSSYSYAHYQSKSIWICFLIKVAICAILISLTLIEILSLAISEPHRSRPYDSIYYISTSLLFIILIFVLVVQMLGQRNIVASEYLLFFWIILFLCGIPKFYQLVHDYTHQVPDMSSTRFWTFMFFQGFVFVEMMLYFIIQDTKPVLPPSDQNISPEVTANLFSRIIFSWLDKIVYTAYKGDNNEDSYFTLPRQLLIANNLKRFETTWEKEKVKADRINRLRKSRLLHQQQNQGNQQRLLLDEDSIPILSMPQDEEVRIEPGNSNSNNESQNASSTRRNQPSLYKVIAKIFGPMLLLSWCVRLVYDLLNYSNPFLLKVLLRYMSNKIEPAWHGYIYAITFLILQVFGSIFMNWNFFIAIKVCLQLRSSLCGSIYRKTLTMSHEARLKSTAGEIINLMSVDCDRVVDSTMFLYVFWSAILQMTIGMVLLVNELGASVFAGFGALVLLLPVNAFIMAKLQKFEENEMKWKDERIKLLTDVLNGIKVLKLYAWELSFSKKVGDLRNTELSFAKKSNIGWAAIIIVWDMIPYLIMLTTFITYVYSSDTHVLTAEKAFVSLTLFNMLRFPLMMLPWVITSTINASVSMKRIRNFLYEDDIDYTGYHRINTSAREDENAISIVDGSFAWKSSGEATLNDIDLQVKPQEFIAVVGKVGVGKSTLISAMLGELNRRSGSVNVKGRVAYVSQEPWIQNLTLRNNILFGKEYDNLWYNKVIQACALQSDIDLLTAGDSTEIGEKGINLSGGQKQRINLARAVYQDCDIYLMDDPLSAVDAHVGKHLFDEVIGSNGLLANKTRVLVTHGIHWLPFVDCIYVLDKEGRIAERGTYQELLDSEKEFADFLRTFLPKDSESEVQVENSNAETAADINQPVVSTSYQGTQDDGKHVKASAVMQRLISRVSTTDEPHASSFEASRQTHADLSGSSPSNKSGIEIRRRKSSIGIAASPMDGKVTPLMRMISETTNVNNMERRHSEVETQNDVQRALGQLIEKETIETGHVSWKAYISYIVGRGIFLSILMVCSYAAFTTVNVMGNIVITDFTEDPYLANVSRIIDKKHNLTPAERDGIRNKVNHYMTLYGVFGVAGTITVSIFAISQAYGVIRASRALHFKLLDNIMRVPLSFFDTTPLGRIINRFSKDIEAVDHNLPGAINDFVSCLMAVAGSLVVISYATPKFIIMLIPMALIYYVIQLFSVPLSRESRRLDSTTRSPLYTQFGEIIAGASVIRAYNEQQRFSRQSNAAIDNNGRFWYLKFSANRWLAIRLEFLSGLVVFGATLFATIDREDLNAALVGLSVSYALTVTDNLNWLVRQVTEMETDAVSLERIMEYSQLEHEAEWEHPNANLAIDWPTEGHVKLDRYSTRYRENLPLILKQVSVNIQPGECVGIVGRTGAGKSSLTLALFRIIESVNGSIILDNVPISTIGLHQLRKRITILPQDPVIFSGSLRDNLDPFKEHSDASVWEAIDQAHLGEWVRGLDDQLNHECGEGGNNLSVGQRQLVCLSRALLRRSKVLVLDEATAAVDLDTDQLIMNTIRQAFRGSTMIIIAHRLATVIDADKILVLDKGEVVEFDSPKNLLLNEDGYFYSLAKNAGLV